MGSLDLGVFVHELNHAVHGPWIINNAVWEEGMARASEVAEMNILAARGITAATSYFDLHHGYSYDEYYDNSNVKDVGVSGGSLRGLGDPGLVLLRYEQSGYAFGKLLIETPGALKMFNARLFHQPSGNLSVSALEGMMTAVKPKVEQTASPTWFARQQIFNSTPPSGCVLFQRSSQYSVDLFSRSSGGLETPLSSPVTMHVYNYTGQLLWSGTASTSPAYGVVTFNPQLGSYNGAIKLVASAVAPCGTVHSTFYRQSGVENGIFGVVRRGHRNGHLHLAHQGIRELHCTRRQRSILRTETYGSRRDGGPQFLRSGQDGQPGHHQGCEQLLGGPQRRLGIRNRGGTVGRTATLWVPRRSHPGRQSGPTPTDGRSGFVPVVADMSLRPDDQGRFRRTCGQLCGKSGELAREMSQIGARPPRSIEFRRWPIRLRGVGRTMRSRCPHRTSPRSGTNETIRWSAPSSIGSKRRPDALPTTAPPPPMSVTSPHTWAEFAVPVSPVPSHLRCNSQSHSLRFGAAQGRQVETRRWIS